jgi:hypothetical protein
MICIVEANAPQAKNTPFFRSSSMAVVAKVEPTLKYDILDITAHLMRLPGMQVCCSCSEKTPGEKRVG